MYFLLLSLSSFWSAGLSIVTSSGSLLSLHTRGALVKLCTVNSNGMAFQTCAQVKGDVDDVRAGNYAGPEEEEEEEKTRSTYICDGVQLDLPGLQTRHGYGVGGPDGDDPTALQGLLLASADELAADVSLQEQVACAHTRLRVSKEEATAPCESETMHGLVAYRARRLAGPAGGSSRAAGVAWAPARW